MSLHNLVSSAWSWQVDSELGKIPGVVEVNVNYVADTIEVQFNPAKVTVEEIRALIKNLERGSAQPLTVKSHTTLNRNTF